MKKKKIKVILFSEDKKPRILINPENLEELKAHPMAVIDPDLSKVHGVPVEHWKLKDGEIVSMPLRERKKIDKKIRKELERVKQKQQLIPVQEKKACKPLEYSILLVLSVIASYYVNKHELIDKAIKEIINVYQSI